MNIFVKLMEKHTERRTKVKRQKIRSMIDGADIIFDDNVEGYNGSFSGYIRSMEYHSGMKYEELINHPWKYFKAFRKIFKVASNVIRMIEISPLELWLKQLREEGEAPYLQYPEAEREARWYNDWFLSKSFSHFIDIGYDYVINEWFSVRLNYGRRGTMVEIPELKAHFSSGDLIYVCEEMKILIIVEMIPIYGGDRDIDVVVAADYNNSPFFNEKYLTDNEEMKKFYFRQINKKAKKKGFSEINQDALLKIMENEKNAGKIETIWRLYGRKLSQKTHLSGGIDDIINKVEDEKLKNILGTYIICPAEYMYKPFVELEEFPAKQLIFSSTASECLYNIDHVMGSTREELEERLNASEYLTEYYHATEREEYKYRDVKKERAEREAKEKADEKMNGSNEMKWKEKITSYLKKWLIAVIHNKNLDLFNIGIYKW